MQALKSWAKAFRTQKTALMCVSSIVAFIVKNINPIIFFACFISKLDSSQVEI